MTDGSVATPPKGPSRGICVIIAAYNAADTIARAVRSALDQPDVVEVRVIDDASTDATAALASACDDDTGRLTVRRLSANAGPSAARNIAVAESSAPFVAILDADDFYLPGRFAALFAMPDWDMAADNIAFIDQGAIATLDHAAIAAHRTTAATLSPAAFVEGCISRRDRYKGELGFLKPVMARAFLDRHALRYAETMRLSEDFDLYVRALIAGARFRLSDTCGYVAVERAGSLSTVHSLGDIEAVERAVGALLGIAPMADTGLQTALRRLQAQTHRKRLLRTLLARKKAIGTVDALREVVRSPGDLFGLATDIARDKWRGVRDRFTRPKTPRTGIRFLR